MSPRAPPIDTQECETLSSTVTDSSPTQTAFDEESINRMLHVITHFKSIWEYGIHRLEVIMFVLAFIA